MTYSVARARLNSPGRGHVPGSDDASGWRPHHIWWAILAGDALFWALLIWGIRSLWQAVLS